MISEAKTKTPFRQVPVERLDAEAVARQEEPAALAVPDREREHAVEALDAARRPTPRRRGRPPRCRCASGRRGPSASSSTRSSLEVVDLAVVVEDDVAGLVRHRLAAGGGEIDDREAPVAEPDRAVGVDALAVRAPVLRSGPSCGPRGRSRPARRRGSQTPAMPHIGPTVAALEPAVNPALRSVYGPTRPRSRPRALRAMRTGRANAARIAPCRPISASSARRVGQQLLHDRLDRRGSAEITGISERISGGSGPRSLFTEVRHRRPRQRHRLDGQAAVPADESWSTTTSARP